MLEVLKLVFTCRVFLLKQHPCLSQFLRTSRSKESFGQCDLCPEELTIGIGVRKYKSKFDLNIFISPPHDSIGGGKIRAYASRKVIKCF